MKKIFKNAYIIFASIFIMLIFSYVASAQKKSNELFIKASKEMDKARSEEKSYSIAFDYYMRARANIDRILTMHSTSDIAVRLYSWEARISGFTLNEFNKIESPLKIMAAAEKDLLLCAFIIAQGIESEIFKASAFAHIASNYAETGQLAQALHMTEAIKDDGHKSLVLLRIGGAYIEIGQQENAEKILSKASVAAKAIKNNRDKALRLISIAGRYVVIGRQEIAESLLSKAYATVRLINNTKEKSFIFLKMASKYAEMEQFPQALMMAMTIEDEYFKALSLTAIAKKHVDIGQRETAERLLSQALDIVRSIANERLKAIALTEIAGKYVEAEQNEEAVRILFQALETTQAIENGRSETWALARIADKYVEAGQNEEAVRILSQALGTVKAMENEWSKALTLAEIAVKYVQTGHNPSQKDLNLLSEILHLKYPIKSFWYKFIKNFKQTDWYLGALALQEAESSRGSREWIQQRTKSYPEDAYDWFYFVYDEKDRYTGGTRLALAGVSGSFVDSVTAGGLFVIRGNVRNKYPHSRSSMQVKGSILDKKGKLVLSRTAYAGNAKSDEDLDKMSVEDIKKSMNNRYGTDNVNRNVDSGVSLPFMIVFENLPENVAEFTVETFSSVHGPAQ